MLNMLISSLSCFIYMNKLLSPFCCNWFILHGCPLAPYLYFITVDALGCSLKVAHFYGKIRGIFLLDGCEMFNNDFANDSLLLVSVERSSIDSAHAFFDTFYLELGVVVSDHKTNF